MKSPTAFYSQQLKKHQDEVKSLFKKYKLIEKLVDEITDTDSKISDNLFNNVKIIKHCKITIDRITKFRIE